jgi:hypothetical protein
MYGFILICCLGYFKAILIAFADAARRSFLSCVSDFLATTPHNCNRELNNNYWLIIVEAL